MRVCIFALLSLLLANAVIAFRLGSAPLTRFSASNRALAAAVKKPTPPTKEEAAQYWQGEWVCADCGYIYDIDVDGGGLYFEQQQRGFICPQCSAPRKRYAKKVGDTWGVTRDGTSFHLSQPNRRAC